MRFLTNIIGKNKRGNMTEFKVGDRLKNTYNNKKGTVKEITKIYFHVRFDDFGDSEEFGYRICDFDRVFKKLKPIKPIEEGDRVVLIDSNIKLIIGKKGKIVSSRWGTDFQVELDNNEGSIVISSEKLRRLVKKKKNPEPKFKVGESVYAINGFLGGKCFGEIVDIIKSEYGYSYHIKYYGFNIKEFVPENKIQKEDYFCFTYPEDKLRLNAQKDEIKSLKDSVESIKDTVNSQKSQIDRNLSKINELEKKNKEKDLKINAILNEFGKDINYLSGVWLGIIAN